MSCSKLVDSSLAPFVDFHVHSTFSPDAEDTVEAMCEAAVQAGLNAICFTDHVDFEPRDASHGYLRFDAYQKALEEAAAKWQGVLEVRMGIEADYQVWYTNELREFLSGRNLDFVLGSVHWVESLSATGEVFDRYGREESCRRYLQNVLGLARSGLYDSLAHLDFIKRYAFERYGKAPLEAFADEIEAILKALIDNGTALEINTSGLRRPVHETLPGVETLRLYRRLGGELVTFGSDAHRVQHAGFAIPYAVDLARSIGFRYVTVFRGRKPVFISLE